MGIQLHAVIIAWPGWIEAARSIAAAVQPAVDGLTVVWSDREAEEQTGPGDWVRVPNDHFFGPKMARGMQAAAGQHLLLIHADTQCDDWPRLAERCRAAFLAHSDIGLWAPEIDHTYWDPKVVAMSSLPGELGLQTVAQTDGIVAAFSPDVMERLAELAPETNNLGWGLDHAAVAFARCKGKLVVRDPHVAIRHHPSTGYDDAEARQQMAEFLERLTAAERDQFMLLEGYANNRRKELRRKRSLLQRLLGRRGV